MAEARTGYIEQTDGRLYYEVAGEGETLVLGHAGFVDGSMWDDQWDVFAQQYRVIRYDMRGYGKSDPAPGPRNRRHDLAELLQHLDVERCALLGCSMSGTIMLDFALEHPEMVTALMTASSAPSGYQPEGAPPPEIMEMFQAAKQGDTRASRSFRYASGLRPNPPAGSGEPGGSPARRSNEPHPGRAEHFFVADLQPFEPLEPPAIDRLDTITSRRWWWSGRSITPRLYTRLT